MLPSDGPGFVRPDLMIRNSYRCQWLVLATDRNAARLMEMFTRAGEIPTEHPPERIGEVEIPKL
jgi:hypothetical protein